MPSLPLPSPRCLALPEALTHQSVMEPVALHGPGALVSAMASFAAPRASTVRLPHGRSVRSRRRLARCVSAGTASAFSARSVAAVRLPLWPQPGVSRGARSACLPLGSVRCASDNKVCAFCPPALSTLFVALFFFARGACKGWRALLHVVFVRTPALLPSLCVFLEGVSVSYYCILKAIDRAW